MRVAPEMKSCCILPRSERVAELNSDRSRPQAVTEELTLAGEDAAERVVVRTRQIAPEQIDVEMIDRDARRRVQFGVAARSRVRQRMNVAIERPDVGRVGADERGV